MLLLSSALSARADERWVQYGSTGPEIRVATGAAACPSAMVDGKAIALSTRSTPGPEFPIRVCFAPVPKGAVAASVGGVALPLPRAQPNKIMLLGDTGCRINALQAQACNDPRAWPFAAGSKAAALDLPDLVIHVGDFHYRERACPLAERGCKDSAFGDSWDVWTADFFEPGRPLLKAAPWVMVRGNHEECGRGGKGWSRALDPYPLQSSNVCLPSADPFGVDLGGLTLIVMDTATAGEIRVNTAQSERFRRQYEQIETLAPSGPVWITAHRPVWSVVARLLNVAVGGNATLAAASSAIPARVDMILSGHLHTFQIVDFEESRPVQVISGNGGSELHITASNSPAGLTVQGAKIREGRGASGVYGYAMLERRADGGWSVIERDFDGKTLVTCEAAARRIACR